MKSFNDHTGLRNKDKGWMTPFDFHGSKACPILLTHDKLHFRAYESKEKCGNVFGRCKKTEEREGTPR